MKFPFNCSQNYSSIISNQKWAFKGFSEFHIDDVPIGSSSLIQFPSFSKEVPKVWHLEKKEKKDPKVIIPQNLLFTFSNKTKKIWLSKVVVPKRSTFYVPKVLKVNLKKKVPRWCVTFHVPKPEVPNGVMRNFEVVLS
jgi:hypothetical protein